MAAKDSNEAPADAPSRESKRDTQRDLRLRAAWLYYVEGSTQSEVAQRLGVHRVMITRLLSEARARGEVSIRIQSDLAPLIALERQLETRFGLDRAILAPMGDPTADPTRAIAAVAGAYVSGQMANGLTVGVGWGRTLHTMLSHMEGRALSGVRVVSLLGGIAQARRFNPAEFAWQFAELFNAEGYLIPAPAIVDSPQTRHALLEQCGLDQIFQMAEGCDLALISCGGISSMTTSYRVGYVSEAERQSMVAAGIVGDVLYNFIGADGARIDHPVNHRAIALPMERLARIPTKILISGGPEKVPVIRAATTALAPKVLITDEITAAALIDGQSARTP